MSLIIMRVKARKRSLLIIADTIWDLDSEQYVDVNTFATLILVLSKHTSRKGVAEMVLIIHNLITNWFPEI